MPITDRFICTESAVGEVKVDVELENALDRERAVLGEIGEEFLPELKLK